MNLLRRLPLMLWIVAVGGAALAASGWRGPSVSAAALPAVGRATMAPSIDEDTLTRAAEHVTATDPFRLDRHPAAVAYQVSLPGGDAAQVVTRPPRPLLVLKGIVGARRPVSWVALLDGVPGRAATAVVHEGDTLGGLRVRRIGRDTVVVTATDTTWRLTVRRAWQ